MTALSSLELYISFTSPPGASYDAFTPLGIILVSLLGGAFGLLSETGRIRLRTWVDAEYGARPILTVESKDKEEYTK